MVFVLEADQTAGILLMPSPRDEVRFNEATRYPRQPRRRLATILFEVSYRHEKSDVLAHSFH